MIWFKIHEGRNYNLLLRWWNFGFPYLLFSKERVWAQIYNEYIRRIGLNPDYMKYLDSLKSLAILELDCVITPSPIMKVRLAQEIENLQQKKTEKGVSYNEIIANISKQQGYSVWKVSVLEFYSYVKINGK